MASELFVSPCLVRGKPQSVLSYSSGRLYMAVVTEGKLGAVIVFSLFAGIVIGLFAGYMMWVLRIFGCIVSVPC